MKVTKLTMAPAKINAEIELDQQETDRLLEASQASLSKLLSGPSATDIDGEYSAEDAATDTKVDAAKFDDTETPLPSGYRMTN